MKFEDLEHRAGELASSIDELSRNLGQFIDNVNEHNETAEIVRSLLAARTIKDELDAAVKQISTQLNLLKQHTVPKHFDMKGISTITVEGYRFTVSTRLSASFQNKEEGHQWLRDNELGDIIVPTVNAQTLAKVAKELIEDGFELDPDIFNVSYVDNTSITKVKK